MWIASVFCCLALYLAVLSVTCVMVIRVFFTFSFLPMQDMHIQKVARSTSSKLLDLPDCIALGHPYRRKNQPNQKMVKGTWPFLFNLLYSSEVSFDGTLCMSCLTCPIYCTPCGTQIKRNAYYWTMRFAETRYFLCIPCYRANTVKEKWVYLRNSTLEETDEPVLWII